MTEDEPIGWDDSYIFDGKPKFLRDCSRDELLSIIRDFQSVCRSANRTISKMMAFSRAV